ncbi:MAG TPA: pitrilysin family protein [Segeticoccus sp.]|uniref:M16 family metallopeptidase n=1 Tax=Segeticoccus sp. TaxID=2706531 RepID=UPI002D808EF6|nr:pitrilysin family protein [Segeticoccus sp.]HET8602209.1 pitrilysin family protein [Segeticoccus sp.]
MSTGQPGLATLPPRPEVQPAEPWEFPGARRGELPNGMTTVAYDIPGQYVLSLRVAFHAPLRLEPRDREGVGTIMARTMDEGTRSHDADEMAEALERAGIAVGAGMAESGLVVDVDVAPRHFARALELLTEFLSEPAFPEAEVARHVRARLAEIEHERAAPGSRAALEFLRTYFQPSERAARPAAGARDTVARITRDDVAAFHARHVHPDRATLVVAGDLSGLDVDAQLAATLGAWTTTPPVEEDPAPDPGAHRARASRRRRDDAARIVFVDRPGSVQTELYVGCPGPDRRTKGGWSAYSVLGFVLGGSPNARIDAVLREEKGFTYGIRSGFRPHHRGGLFLTSGSVRADSTAESLGLLLDILDGAREGFTEEEAREGVDYVGRTAPGRFATSDAVADEAALLALDGLTTDFTSQTLAGLADLDAQALGDAYDRYVTGEWTVIVVGDAKEYADPVRRLRRGDVTVVPA